MYHREQVTSAVANARRIAARATSEDEEKFLTEVPREGAAERAAHGYIPLQGVDRSEFYSLTMIFQFSRPLNGVSNRN